MTEAKKHDYNQRYKQDRKPLLWAVYLALLTAIFLPYAETYAQKIDSLDVLCTTDDILAKKGEVLPKGDKDTDKLEAQRYYYEGRLQEAHKEFDKALKLYLKSDSLWSNNAVTLHGVATCYRRLGNADKARHYYEKAYRLDSSDRDFAFDLAQTYAQERKYEEGSQIINAWLKRDASDGSALEYSAKLYYALGEYQKAIDRYDELERLNAKDFEVCRQLAQFKAGLYRMLGEEEKADREILSLADKFPSVEALKAFIVNEFYIQKLYEKGLKLLHSYAAKGEIAPDEKDSLELIGLFSLMRYQEAKPILERFIANPKVELRVKITSLKEFIAGKTSDDVVPSKYNYLWERLLKDYPDSTDLCFAYAENLRLQKNFTRSIDLLRPLIKQEPKNKDLWEGLIGDAISLEDNDLISDFCLQAIDYVKDDWRNYYYASVGLYLKKNLKGAEGVLMKGIAQLDTVELQDRFALSMLHGQLGDLYGEMGKEKEQVKAYDKSLKLNENNPAVLNNYAYHLSKKEIRLNDAERMAALGVRLNADDANLLETYAWILYQTKKYALASLYMRKAIDEGKKSDDVSAVFYEHYGFIHEAQGEKAEAKECFQKALELYPKELKEKSDDKSKRKEIKKAMRRIKKALKKLK